LAILCPSAATHGLWTKRVAEFSVHILVEKPYAASLQEADEMAAAVASTGKLLAINWPLRWMPVSITARRLLDEGVIGDVLNVYHHGGNRGPLYHGADKREKVPTTEEKAASWFYKRDQGGGSLLDYAGYGTTLGTWYHNGRKPLEVTCMTAGDPALRRHGAIVPPGGGPARARTEERAVGSGVRPGPPVGDARGARSGSTDPAPCA